MKFKKKKKRLWHCEYIFTQPPPQWAGYNPRSIFKQSINKSKVGDRSQGRPEGSLFNSYYTEV